MSHLKLVTETIPNVPPSQLDPDEQWLWTAIMVLLREVSTLKKKVADLEGRERL